MIPERAPVQFATSGTARLAYEVTGPGVPGGDILLIHAGVTDRRSWHHVTRRLNGRYRCAVYDARAYGETTYEREEGWSAVDDALAVIDAAGLDRPIVVACSIGGQAAIDLALAHPDRISGLILIGSAIRGGLYPELVDGATYMLNAQIDEAFMNGDGDEVNRLEAWLWLDGPAGPEGRVGGPARELFLAMNGGALVAPDPGPEAELEPAWPRLGELRLPVRILLGALDAEDIIFVNERASVLIPDADFFRLEAVAHLPHLEGDAVTLDLITEFVDRHAVAVA